MAIRSGTMLSGDHWMNFSANVASASAIWGWASRLVRDWRREKNEWVGVDIESPRVILL
jgi:hypothetical protein